MAKDKNGSDDLPQRDRAGAAGRMADRRKQDNVTGYGVGNDDRPTHPDGWQPGGR